MIVNAEPKNFLAVFLRAIDPMLLDNREIRSASEGQIIGMTQSVLILERWIIQQPLATRISEKIVIYQF